MAAVNGVWKSTRVARNPGVSIFAMLSAITRCWRERPPSALVSTDCTASDAKSGTDLPDVRLLAWVVMLAAGPSAM
jgi:hypothetical protein